MAKTLLIAGLGNPGEKYEKTRHNAGFLALEELKKELGSSQWQLKKAFNAEISNISFGDELTVILVQPQTFMNVSGTAIEAVRSFYKVNADDIAVVYDDKDLHIGTVKTKIGGGSAGHNGIKSLPADIQKHGLKIRIGVANKQLEHIDTADFVLKNFSKKELHFLIESIIPEVIEVISTEFIAPKTRS